MRRKDRMTKWIAGIAAAGIKEPETPSENPDIKSDVPETKTSEVKAKETSKETAKATEMVSKKKTAVKTGDESKFVWLLSLMGLSGCGLIAVEMMRRKRD